MLGRAPQEPTLTEFPGVAMFVGSEMQRCPDPPRYITAHGGDLHPEQGWCSSSGNRSVHPALHPPALSISPKLLRAGAGHLLIPGASGEASSVMDVHVHVLQCHWRLPVPCGMMAGPAQVTCGGPALKPALYHKLGTICRHCCCIGKCGVGTITLLGGLSQGQAGSVGLAGS